ncbi:hypothetical protein H9Q72_006158 [Fusarium xylarioides]|uniref:Uncharacterized protein n=1 Tax=Fusarium xylarioides TaxID=221167 RepID=A0A9P7HTJ7_9HYPO|nr:hypothetical protein H9Q72_006158 [Fusarium xylarioides]
MLLERGAELDSPNKYHETPRQLFNSKSSPDPLTDTQRRFLNRQLSFLQSESQGQKKLGNLPLEPVDYTRLIRQDCMHFPVYFRHQWAGYIPGAEKETCLSWSPTGIKVSHVLYRKLKDSYMLTEDRAAGLSSDGETSGSDDDEKEEAVEKGDVLKSRFLVDCESQFTESVNRLLQEGKLDDHQTGVDNNSMVQSQLHPKDFQERSWKWINFPLNNDFVTTNIRSSDSSRVDPYAWRFFGSNIRVRETNDSNARVRKPHAYIKEKPDHKERKNPKSIPQKGPAKGSSSEDARGLGDQKPHTPEKISQQASDTKEFPSWVNAECFVKGSSMISLVLPFLDFESEIEQGNEGMTEQERVIQRRYSPFTGMHGVQRSQTLDDTASGFGQTSSTHNDLRTKEEQVVYRWSKNKSEAQAKDEHQDVKATVSGTKSLRIQRYWPRGWFQKQKREVAEEAEAGVELADRRAERMGYRSNNRAKAKAVNKAKNEAIQQKLRPEPGTNERANEKKDNRATEKAIQQNPRKSWLMVRQLWLWKLDENTIITTIPTRGSDTIAEDLFETIKQGNLYTVRSSGDLIKRIISETVKFIDEFKWAGLGHHVLDIFEGEISNEMDKEAGYYKDFEATVKNLDLVNKMILEAAHSTWQLKDIRDELRLLQRLFETQLEVVRKVADILWPTKLLGKPSLTKEERQTLRANFIRDLGLENLIQRVKRLNQDAYTTLEGVSTIIQAMQAQASLKEAESARFMNHIILPFTVVTVIFVSVPGME